MTVKELKKQLKAFPDDCEVQFGGGMLDFLRLIRRGEIVEVEFMQTVCLAKDGRILVEVHSGPQRSFAPV